MHSVRVVGGVLLLQVGDADDVRGLRPGVIHPVPAALRAATARSTAIATATGRSAGFAATNKSAVAAAAAAAAAA